MCLLSLYMHYQFNRANKIQINMIIKSKNTQIKITTCARKISGGFSLKKKSVKGHMEFVKKGVHISQYCQAITCVLPRPLHLGLDLIHSR